MLKGRRLKQNLCFPITSTKITINCLKCSLCIPFFSRLWKCYLSSSNQQIIYLYHLRIVFNNPIKIEKLSAKCSGVLWNIDVKIFLKLFLEHFFVNMDFPWGRSLLKFSIFTYFRQWIKDSAIFR